MVTLAQGAMESQAWSMNDVAGSPVGDRRAGLTPRSWGDGVGSLMNQVAHDTDITRIIVEQPRAYAS